MGKKKISTPDISPNFGCRELKIFQLLDIYGRYLRSEFRDLSPKNVAWGDDHINSKNHIFSTRGGISKEFTDQSSKRR